MWEKLIAYFAKRHLITNFIVVGIIIGGIFSWHNTRKEEWPDITFDRISVSVRYPGAPANDVEYFVTKPIEEAVRGIDGVYRITSTSSVSQSSVSIEIEQGYPDFKEAIADIRNAVLDVELPSDITDDPHVRIFRSSKKAIIDIALIHTGAHLLDEERRRQLQSYAFALENQLITLPEVSSVNKRGYLQEELQIKTYPDRLLKYNIPFNTVMNEIRNNHLRQPAGTIETKDEPKVTLSSELDTIEELENLIIQGGFEGKVIRLGEVADIRTAYERNKQIVKINGHEGIMFSVVKAGSAGIIETLDVVEKTVQAFRETNLSDVPIELLLLDDESIDVRNRLSLISTNGLIGFVLILVILFTFLNIRSGVWVALGIPFTLCFTMVWSSFLGYTINGTTLAAVIIVMGIIVDDAIVVAENITRMAHSGVSRQEAVVKGTSVVILPILASILTTCIAFVPLFFFSGRYGRFIQFIPPIIFLVLGASLFESICILPGHMDLPLPFIGSKGRLDAAPSGRQHWFGRVEVWYGRILERMLPLKWIIFAVFAFLLIVSGWIATEKMKFVMFPNEETRDIVVVGEAPSGTMRYETAELTKQIEDVIVPYCGKEVVGVRTEIARSRRGGAVEENKFRMIIEIVPKEKRKKSADTLVKEFQKAIEPIQGFEEIRFQKSRWGQSSGSPIEIMVQQNDDGVRETIIAWLEESLGVHPALENVERGSEQFVGEYKIDVDRDKLKRLSIEPKDIASTFRAALEGSILYEFSNGDEDVQVRFTIVDEAKDDIYKVLDLPVENRGNYLVPLRDIVHVAEDRVPNSIERQDLKRTSLIDADIRKGAGKTPVEVAEDIEKNIFPKIIARYPTTTLSFSGEVKDTRESRADFKNAIILAVSLIYIILAVLFNSLLKPLIIMLAIPFGVVGVVFAFWAHGKVLFGFYAAVGALGLAGVVINDSIIMLAKLDREYDSTQSKDVSNRQIADIAQTRLRAVVLTTITTVAGVLPTAYGFAGYDATLAEMMLALAWGLVFGTVITLLLIPCVYSVAKDLGHRFVYSRKEG